MDTLLVLWLFVECPPLRFLAVNTEWLKYCKHLFNPANLTVRVAWIGHLFPWVIWPLVSKLRVDLAMVFTLALLEDEINMLALAVFNWSPGPTWCWAKETHRLATISILDILKKPKQEPVTHYGIQTSVEGDGDGDPSSTTVEDFLVNF